MLREQFFSDELKRLVIRPATLFLEVSLCFSFNVANKGCYRGNKLEKNSNFNASIPNQNRKKGDESNWNSF